MKLWHEAWRIVEAGADPNLGLVLDSFHTLSLKDDPCGIADLPGDKILFVQMADAPRLDLNVIEWARHHRNFRAARGRLRRLRYAQCPARTAALAQQQTPGPR